MPICLQKDCHKKNCVVSFKGQMYSHWPVPGTVCRHTRRPFLQSSFWSTAQRPSSTAFGSSRFITLKVYLAVFCVVEIFRMKTCFFRKMETATRKCSLVATWHDGECQIRSRLFKWLSMQEASEYGIPQDRTQKTEGPMVRVYIWVNSQILTLILTLAFTSLKLAFVWSNGACVHWGFVAHFICELFVLAHFAHTTSAVYPFDIFYMKTGPDGLHLQLNLIFLNIKPFWVIRYFIWF